MIPAQATEDTTAYYLRDIGMTIEIPSDIRTFTRETSKDDPRFAAEGIEYEDYMSMMKMSDLFLSSVSKGREYEISLSMVRGDSIWSLKNSSRVDYELLLDGLKQNYQESGVEISKAEYYETDQEKFICLMYKLPIGAEFIEYLTVHDLMNIHITLLTTDGGVTEDMKETMKNVIDSITFDAYQQGATGQPSSVNAEAPRIIYQNPKLGVEFIVPSGWAEESVDEQSIQKKKYVFKEEKNEEIVFLQEDASAVVKDAADFSDISLEDAKTYLKKLDPSYEELLLCTYGNQSYYSAESADAKDKEEGAILKKAFFTIKNGNVYCFVHQYVKGMPEETTKFPAFLESIKFTELTKQEVPAEALPAPKPQEVPENQQSTLLTILLATVCSLLPIAVYRFLIKKSPVRRVPSISIAVAYGIILFGIAFAFPIINKNIAFFVITLWGFVNYYLLRLGANFEEEVRQEREASVKKSKSDVLESDFRDWSKSLKKVNSEEKVSEEKTEEKVVVKVSAKTKAKPLPAEEVAKSTESAPILTEERPIAGSLVEKPFAVPEESSSVSVEKNPDSDAVYCYQCGALLNPGAVFCHQCGAEIKKR